MKSSSSMKNLPIQNNYIIPGYSNYYDMNNYQIVNNQQQNKLLHRQESSLLLPVQNNLFNMINQPPQPILSPRETPKVKIDLQNIDPIITPAKSEQKIIRIQKKLFKRIPSSKIINQKSSNYVVNNSKNFYVNNKNNNHNINFLNNSQNNYSLYDANSNNGLYFQNYEITTPIKNNKIVSYNSLNKLEKDNNFTYSKLENKLNNQNNNIIYYSDVKSYNSQNFNNYLTDILPIENNEKLNEISEAKINVSMNNLTTNYLLNNNIKYPSSNNIEINKKNINIQKQNLSNKNLSKNNLYNNYYAEYKNDYFQTDINNQINYNLGFYPINNLKNSRSLSNIKLGNEFKDYNNNLKTNTQNKLNNRNFIRSISSSNIKPYNSGYNNNQLNNIPTKKIQNISILKDPIAYNNINDYQNNNYLNQELPSYHGINTIKSNNNINNNYNINFNININHDYTNPKPSNNKYNLNATNNNNLPIKFPELEPSSNFNLSEFVKLGIMGKGTEGIIYSVKWKKNNKNYALKKGVIKLIEVVKKRQQEINMLKEFRRKTGSDGVINIYGYLCLTNKQNHYNYDFYELMELAELDWDKEIERRAKIRQYYPEYELINIMHQIVYTFYLLQMNHITHRDIKPQNIIIVNGKYKIIDFGNARIMNRGGLVIQRIRGSEMYMSPVMFKTYHSKMTRVKHNTFKSDVFSLGMCFLLAVTLSYNPLNTIREIYDFSLISKIVRNYIGNRYSENIKNLILPMLQIEENLRPDFIELEKIFEKINRYK